ncbi:2,4-dichlorophenol 6-monooxygenase [compost metagenome]
MGRGRFTLLTGAGGQVWREAAAALKEALDIDVMVVSIGGPGCDAQDVYGRWQAVSGIADDGCVLVRPDRHVAWRQQAADAHTARDLLDVMSRVLGRATEAAPLRAAA